MTLLLFPLLLAFPLDEVARVATAMLDGDQCKRIETPRSRSFAQKTDPRDPWAASDNYDVDHAAFTAVKKATMRLATLCDVACDVNVWMPVEGDSARVQVVVRNIHEISQFWPWGALNQPIPDEFREVLATGKRVEVRKIRDHVSVLTPIYDSLGDVVGLAEVAARTRPDPSENVK